MLCWFNFSLLENNAVTLINFKIERNHQIECRKPCSNVKRALVMIMQKPKAGQISSLDLHLEYKENILTSEK